MVLADMTANKRQLGSIAEQAVCEYLQAKGYVICGRNLFLGHLAEIDILARSPDNYLCFIEVRSRTKLHRGFQYLSAKKLHHLRLGALLWLKQNGYPLYETAWRVDLVVKNNSHFFHYPAIM